jgi:hypothetical protein
VLIEIATDYLVLETNSKNNMPDITPLIRKVLVIDFQPSGLPARWNRTDDLIPDYIEAIGRVSQDILKFHVVEKLVVSEFPFLVDGSQYTETTFIGALADDSSALRDADGRYLFADYDRIIQQFDLIQKAESEQSDEIWMFGGPYFGFYESRMVGRDAFWCNGPGMERDCRRFVIMGFNYERDVKEMVHDYGHRAENILAKHFDSETFLRMLYRQQPNLTPTNAYEQFLLEVGTVHRKPGGEEYGQDEFAWLTAMRPSWWPPTIDPNLVDVTQPVSPGSAESKMAVPKPWYQAILDFFASLFGKD